MNKTTCWYCKTEFEYDGEQYRDVVCSHCKVLNSILNPNKPELTTEVKPKTTHDEWVEKREREDGKMAINYGDEKYQGKFVYLPIMGQSAEFDIEEISEVKSDNPKFNFSENVPVLINGEQGIDDDGEPLFKKKDLGYHVEARLKNGKVLSITSMAAFIQVFKKHEIQDGEKVKVEHLDKGLWKVTKL